MTTPDSGPLDHEQQLDRLAEEVRAALAAGEELHSSALAERFGVAEDQVEQLILALRILHESLDEDLQTSTDLPAPELPDDYEVGDELGRGGMGIVYRAHQKSLDRDVAVKVLRPGDLQFGSAIARFENEARSLARLRHRHIVSVHEVGKASGFVYFTMDLIEGMSLQELIASDRMTNGRAVKLLRQVASAMTYAHGQGVVHRDLKPANILVDQNDDAFVVDFGLARDLGTTSDATLSGQMMGTPAYMSPEQALGDRDKIGEATDIYALGAVLYECLTGKRPFANMPLAQLMHAVIHDDPIAPRKLNPRVPRDLEVICQTAMQKRVEDRYATVLAMAEDLERFSIGREILARRQSRTSRLLRFTKQHRKPLTAGVLPAIVLITLGWMFLLPSLLRDRDLRLGDQMLAEGNDTGAVLAYRSAFAATDPQDLELSVRVRLARALTNQAGKLLLSGAKDAKAAPLLAEASNLLGKEHGIRYSTTTFDEDNASYEWLRVEALQGKFAQLINNANRNLLARVRRDLTGSSRDATLCLLAMWLATGAGSTLTEFGEDGCDALVELVQKWQFLKDPIRSRFEGLVLGGTSNRLFEHPAAPYLEAKLITLVRDESLPKETRKAAAALFNGSDTLPFGRRFVSKSGPGWMNQVVIVEDSDLPRLVTAWDEIQKLPRAEAFSRSIEFVGESLHRRLGKTDPQNKRLSYKLAGWLRRRTGANLERESDWLNWLDANRERAPQTWLLEALNWNIEPAELTPAKVVARFRQPGRQRANQPTLLHYLLTLIVDEGIEAPKLPRTGSTQLQWEHVLGARPDLRHPVRVAMLGFINGDPKPQILWQTRQVLGIDERFAWLEAVEPDAKLQITHVGVPRKPWMGASGSPLILRGAMKLSWQEGGVKGQTDSSFQRRIPTYQINNHYPAQPESAVGVVTATEGWIHYPRTGQSYLDVITLTLIEAEDTPDAEWTVSDWQHAANATVQASNDMDAYGLATMASFLPLPDQHTTLRRHFQELQQRSRAEYSNYARCGLLLAGDATAIELPEFEPDKRPFGPERTHTPPSFWIRLALSATDPTIRDYAFEQLRQQPLLPAFKRTLQAARKDGTKLPDWLAEQVRTEPTATVLYIRSHVPAIGGLLLTLLLVIASAASLPRSRNQTSMRLRALALWVASMVLANFSIWIDGTQWNPPWIGYSINVLATWLMCWRAIPHWSWLVAPVAWTGITASQLLGMTPDSEFHAYNGIGIALLVILRMQHNVIEYRVKRRTVRNRRLLRSS